MPMALALIDGALVEIEVGGGGGSVPTLVPAGSTFAIPADTQVLFSEPMTIEGEIDLDGVLVEVS